MDKKENEKPGIKEKNKDVGIKEKEHNKGLIHEQKKPELKAADKNFRNKDTVSLKSNNKVSLRKPDIKESTQKGLVHEQKPLRIKTAESSVSSADADSKKTVDEYSEDIQTDDTYDTNLDKKENKTEREPKADNSGKRRRKKRRKDKNAAAENVPYIKEIDPETKIKVLQVEIDVLEKENTELRAKIDDIDYQLNELNDLLNIANADPASDDLMLHNIRQQEDKLLGERFELSERLWENDNQINNVYNEYKELKKELSDMSNDVPVEKITDG